MSQQPNILFMMPDQLRADFVGCYGADFAKTPNIDALAARGTRYARCLSTAPICVPARASLLTGASTLETGVLTNSQWLRPDHAECGLDTWPDLLRRAGYRTVSVGKMHFYPWDASFGFDDRIIAEDKRHIGIFDDYAEFLEGKGSRKIHAREMAGYKENAGACLSPLPAGDQVDAWCADRAIEYLEKHDRSRPFAMMVGFPSPHCPYDPPADVAARFDPDKMPPACPPTAWTEPMRRWLVQNMKNPWADLDYETFTDDAIAKVRAHYSALTHLVDRAVGRILETLERLGLAENTLVIFTSDHGDFVGDFGLVGKNFFMEGSVHVPLIVASPGQQTALREDTVTLTDLFATLLEIGCIDPPDRSVSRSVLAPPPEITRTVFGAVHRGFFVERDRLKLARYVGGVVTLHDVTADPSEQSNLVECTARAAERDELDAALTDWQISETLKGHGDKMIAFDASAQIDPGRDAAILGRGWSRPYPFPRAASR